jgi:hypothetical protein
VNATIQNNQADFMRTRTSIALAAITFALAACSGSGNDRSASTEQVEANLDAENFDTTITSDEAVLNQTEANQLNVATE